MCPIHLELAVLGHTNSLLFVVLSIYMVISTTAVFDEGYLWHGCEPKLCHSKELEIFTTCRQFMRISVFFTYDNKADFRPMRYRETLIRPGFECDKQLRSHETPPTPAPETDLNFRQPFSLTLRGR